MTKIVNRPLSRDVKWIISVLIVCAVGTVALVILLQWINRPPAWTEYVRKDSAIITQLEELTGVKSDGFERGYSDSSFDFRLFLRFPTLNDYSKLDNALAQVAAKRKWKSVEHDYVENGKCFLAYYDGKRISVLVDFGLGYVGSAPGLSIHFAESEYGWCNLE